MEVLPVPTGFLYQPAHSLRAYDAIKRGCFPFIFITRAIYLARTRGNKFRRYQAGRKHPFLVPEENRGLMISALKRHHCCIIVSRESRSFSWQQNHYRCPTVYLLYCRRATRPGPRSIFRNRNFSSLQLNARSRPSSLGRISRLLENEALRAERMKSAAAFPPFPRE